MTYLILDERVWLFVLIASNADVTLAKRIEGSVDRDIKLIIRSLIAQAANVSI